MNRWRRWCRVAAALVLCSLLALATERLLSILHPFPLERLERPIASQQVSSSDGVLLRVLPNRDGERCLPLPLSELGPHAMPALIAAEDRRFREHGGVDCLAALRAFAQNLVASRRVSGASTISMQVARLLEARPRDWGGKLREAFRARQLERLLDKDAIAEAYLARAPWGGTLRGIEAASRFWYGRPCRMLAVDEVATLIAMLPAPSARRPDRSPAALRAARDRILAELYGNGHIDDDLYRRSRARPINARAHAWPWLAPHACDFALLHEKRHDERLVLPLRYDLQEAIEGVVQRFPLKGIDGLAVVVCNHDGQMRALIGSPDWHTQPFNAALARRSSGSTLKPFIYALAMREHDRHAEQFLADVPRSFAGYRPRNFDLGYRGSLRLDEALSQSRNMPAVQLLAELGIPRFHDYGVRLGLLRPDTAIDLAAALGSHALSPLELARAYAAFMRRPEAAAVLPALRLRRLSGSAADWAWKTGTSSGRRDAWCVGLGSEHVVVVWLGWRDNRSDYELVGSCHARELLESVVAIVTAKVTNTAEL